MKRNKDLVIEPNASLTDRKYTSEKPWSCKYCYWWKGKNKGCGLKQCHYLIPEKEKKRESAVSNKCNGCPMESLFHASVIVLPVFILR